MSNVFSEKANGIAVEDSARLLTSPITQMVKKFTENLIPDYVRSVNEDIGLTYKEIARLAKLRGGEVSASQAQAIGAGDSNNPGVKTLASVGLGLGKPPEDIVLASLGQLAAESAPFRASEFANLWELYKLLPSAEQRIMKRYLEIMRREMLHILKRQEET